MGLAAAWTPTSPRCCRAGDQASPRGFVRTHHTQSRAEGRRGQDGASGSRDMAWEKEEALGITWSTMWGEAEITVCHS